MYYQIYILARPHSPLLVHLLHYFHQTGAKRDSDILDCSTSLVVVMKPMSWLIPLYYVLKPVPTWCFVTSSEFHLSVLDSSEPSNLFRSFLGAHTTMHGKYRPLYVFSDPYVSTLLFTTPPQSVAPSTQPEPHSCTTLVILLPVFGSCTQI